MKLCIVPSPKLYTIHVTICRRDSARFQSAYIYIYSFIGEYPNRDLSWIRNLSHPPQVLSCKQMRCHRPIVVKLLAAIIMLQKQLLAYKMMPDVRNSRSWIKSIQKTWKCWKCWCETNRGLIRIQFKFLFPICSSITFNVLLYVFYHVYWIAVQRWTSPALVLRSCSCSPLSHDRSVGSYLQSSETSFVIFDRSN